MGTRAYILIETQVGMSRNVAASLQSFDKVVNVDVITGPFDVIALIDAADMAAVADLVRGNLFHLQLTNTYMCFTT